MRAVCSGTRGRGCCSWSDMAKPPEITAPTPLSTFRLTHSPTVSDPLWDSCTLVGALQRARPRKLGFGEIARPNRPFAVLTSTNSEVRAHLLSWMSAEMDDRVLSPNAWTDDRPVSSWTSTAAKQCFLEKLTIWAWDRVPQDRTRKQVPGPSHLPAAVLVADCHHRLALASYAHENGCVHRGRPDRPPLLRT